MKKKYSGVNQPGLAVSVRVIIFLLALIASIFLNGCGGGSGGGNNGDDNPTYKSLGVGVTIQSSSDSKMQSMSYQATGFGWKRIDLSLNAPKAQMVPVFRTADSSNSAGIDPTKNIYLMLLAWDKVDRAGHYQVFYQGNKVWDSDTFDIIADGAFDKENPQAYLDFDDELKTVTLAAGPYQFEIKALDGNTVIAELPKVNASLGVYLQAIPEISDFNVTKPDLKWSAITNTIEYRISFNGVNTATVGYSTLSYDVMQKLTASATYYRVWIDARYLDANGNPVEITRGRGGFTY